MAKGGKIKAPVRTALEELKEHANALAPQRGMFSTLDKLIETAPFERGSSEQWRGYLKPGRKFTREGVEFPLKKEEIDYTDIMKTLDALAANGSGADNLSRLLPAESILDPLSPTKDQLLTFLRAQRPGFRLKQGFEGPEASTPKNVAARLKELGDSASGMPARYGPGGDPRLSHQSPGSQYEESATQLDELSHRGHFTNDTLAWGRTSSHDLPSGEKMRLIEEIQSDLHQDAAERSSIDPLGALGTMTRGERIQYDSLTDQSTDFNRLPETPENLAARKAIDDERNALWDEAHKRLPRRGYYTRKDKYDLQEDRETLGKSEDELEDMRRRVQEGVPDAPFKDSSEYAALEMRKQLLNAANAGEDYLAITRGDDQVSRYDLDEHDPKAAAGMRHIYDNVYRSALEKLGKRYGAEMVDVETTVGSSADTRPSWMREAEYETPEDFQNSWSVTTKTHPGDLDEGYFDGFAKIVQQVDPTGERELLPQLLKLAAINAGEREPPHELYDMGSDWNYLVKRTADALEQQIERNQTGEKKTFPALKLTPEIHELIKRAGVPLWSLAGGAAGLEMLEEGDTEAQEQPRARFAKGGKIVPIKPRVKPDLKKLEEMLESLDRPELDPELLKRIGIENISPYKPTKKAKGGKIRTPRTALTELKEYMNSMAPQRGMFSTLDEIVQQAPFENVPAEQWKSYLKPGRMLEREGLQFPLKKEEIDYAQAHTFLDKLNESLQNSILPDKNVTKGELLRHTRSFRPTFRVQESVDDTKDSVEAYARSRASDDSDTRSPRTAFPVSRYGPISDATLSHQSPGSTYQESITRMDSLAHAGHFTDDALSWGRTSSHVLPSNEKMRLIEEIQSDVHGAAAEKVGNFESQTGLREGLQRAGNWNRYKELDAQEAELLQSRWREQDPRYRQKELDSLREEKRELVDNAYAKRPRRGYITPEDEAEYKELYNTLNLTEAQHNRLRDLKLKQADAVPDAPFKDLEYANLELKKQLLNAANAGEDYLALTTGNDQVARYSLDEHDPEAAEGMRFVYDQKMRSMMEKLAKRYGAEIVDVEAPLGSATDVRPDAMRQLGVENPRDFMDAVERGAYMRADGDPYEQLIWDLTPPQTHDHPPSVRAMDAVRDYRKATDAGEDASDELMELDEALTSLWSDHLDAHQTATENQKTFPAIKLTPEVRELIKRAGVPLWSLAGGAAGLELLNEDDAEAEEPQAFAKGGEVEAPYTGGDPYFDPYDMSAHDPTQEERDRQLEDLKHLAMGASNVLGATRDGKLLGVPRSDLSGLSISGWELPGMVTDFASLPDLLSLGHGPEISKRAGEKSQALDEAGRAYFDVGAPQSKRDYLFESGGGMGLQLPTGGLGATKFLPQILERAPAAVRYAAKIPKAISEWFGPTVKGAEGYLQGTLGGAAVMEYLPKLMEKLDVARGKPWALATKASEKGQLPPDLAFEIANHLEPMENADDMFYDTETSAEDNQELLDNLLGE